MTWCVGPGTLVRKRIAATKVLVAERGYFSVGHAAIYQWRMQRVSWAKRGRTRGKLSVNH